MLAATRAIGDEIDQAWTLARLAPYLPKLERRQVLEKALVAALELPEFLQAGIFGSSPRIDALAGLVPHLPAELLEKALAGALAIEDKFWRTKALEKLSPYLPKALLEKALAAARASRDELWRDETLAELAPRLAELGCPEKALKMARAIENDRLQAKVLAGLAPYLSGTLLDEALVVARMIWYKDYRALALAELAFNLPEAERVQVLREALAAVQGIEKEENRAKALTKLVPHLPAEFLKEALSAVRAIEEEKYRAEALTGLALYLSESERAQALREALVAARRLPERDWQGISPRAETLARLAPRLAELGCWKKAIAMVWSLRDVGVQARALAGLISYLPEPEREPALIEALSMARTLPEHDLLGRSPRAETLSELSPYLVTWAERDHQAVYKAWKEMLYFLTRRTRRALLSDLRALAPVIARLGGEEAIAETFRAIQDVGRWWS